MSKKKPFVSTIAAPLGNGIYWARDRQGKWDLVSVQNRKIWVFGWDIESGPDEFSEFQNANLIDPSGTPFTRAE